MQTHAHDTSRIRTSTHPWGTRVELFAPQVRNALDPATVSALTDLFARDEAGAVLLCAHGPVFCAGGDLAVLGQAAADGDLVEILTTGATAFADLVEAIVAGPRPVVAAVDGPAIGGGVSLALACDVRVVTPQARLVLGWGRWGLPPDGGASALLSLAVGPATARGLLMQQASIDADSPLTPLLFSRVVSPERLESSAVTVAEALAGSGGARMAKAVTTALVLPTLRAQRGEEIAALARAAADPAVAARLAMLYKM